MEKRAFLQVLFGGFILRFVFGREDSLDFSVELEYYTSKSWYFPCSFEDE